MTAIKNCFQHHGKFNSANSSGNQKKPALSEDERRIFRLLRQRLMTSSELAQNAGFGKTKTVSLLKRMVRNGYVTKSGKGRGIKYSAQNSA